VRASDRRRGAQPGGRGSARQRGAGLTQEAVVVERDGDDRADLADEALVLVVEGGRFVPGDAEHGDDPPRTRSGTSSRLTMPKRAAYSW
jgi:hypothetical protein